MRQTVLLSDDDYYDDDGDYGEDDDDDDDENYVNDNDEVHPEICRYKPSNSEVLFGLFIQPSPFQMSSILLSKHPAAVPACDCPEA